VRHTTRDSRPIAEEATRCCATPAPAISATRMLPSFVRRHARRRYATRRRLRLRQRPTKRRAPIRTPATYEVWRYADVLLVSSAQRREPSRAQRPAVRLSPCR